MTSARAISGPPSPKPRRCPHCSCACQATRDISSNPAPNAMQTGRVSDTPDAVRSPCGSHARPIIDDMAKQHIVMARSAAAGATRNSTDPSSKDPPSRPMPTATPSAASNRGQLDRPTGFDSETNHNITNPPRIKSCASKSLIRSAMTSAPARVTEAAAATKTRADGLHWLPSASADSARAPHDAVNGSPAAAQIASSRECRSPGARSA